MLDLVDVIVCCVYNIKNAEYLISKVSFYEALLSSSCVYSRPHFTPPMEKGAEAGC